MEIDVAVAEVCALGRKFEESLARIEEAKEAERELRRWKPMPNGGHDPALFQPQAPAQSGEPVRGLSEVPGSQGTVLKSERVLSDQSEK